MNTLGARLRALRADQSQTVFASSMGIPQTTLSNYERDVNQPSLEFIELLCEKFNISIEWFITGKGSMRPGVLTKVVDNGQAYSVASEYLLIPKVEPQLYSRVGESEASYKVIGMYPFKADWILRKGDTEKMVLMRVTGDSMAPEIKHNDVVLIDKSKTAIYGHGYYAVSIEGVVYVKIILTAPGVIIFRSINREYEDICVHISEREATNVRILGRVIWGGREFD